MKSFIFCGIILLILSCFALSADKAERVDRRAYDEAFTPQKGHVVEVHGLTRKDLNGKRGLVIGEVKEGRVPIELQSMRKTFGIKVKNLMYIQEAGAMETKVASEKVKSKEVAETTYKIFDESFSPKLGHVVQIHGLKNAAELNGRHALVLGETQSNDSRVPVSIVDPVPGNETEFKLKNISVRLRNLFFLSKFDNSKYLTGDRTQRKKQLRSMFFYDSQSSRNSIAFFSCNMAKKSRSPFYKSYLELRKAFNSIDRAHAQLFDELPFPKALLETMKMRTYISFFYYKNVQAEKSGGSFDCHTAHKYLNKLDSRRDSYEYAPENVGSFANALRMFDEIIHDNQFINCQEWQVGASKNEEAVAGLWNAASGTKLRDKDIYLSGAETWSPFACHVTAKFWANAFTGRTVHKEREISSISNFQVIGNTVEELKASSKRQQHPLRHSDYMVHCQSVLVRTMDKLLSSVGVFHLQTIALTRSRELAAHNFLILHPDANGGVDPTNPPSDYCFIVSSYRGKRFRETNSPLIKRSCENVKTMLETLSREKNYDEKRKAHTSLFNVSEDVDRLLSLESQYAPFEKNFETLRELFLAAVYRRQARGTANVDEIMPRMEMHVSDVIDTLLPKGEYEKAIRLLRNSSGLSKDEAMEVHKKIFIPASVEIQRVFRGLYGRKTAALLKKQSTAGRKNI